MTDSYLFDAGWLFVVAWSIVVTAVGVVAFGRDLVHSSPRLEPAKEPDHPESR